MRFGTYFSVLYLCNYHLGSRPLVAKELRTTGGTFLVRTRHFTAIVPGTDRTYCETAEQLKPHSLRGLWAPAHLTHSIRARRKVGFEDWLSSTSHIRKNSLSKMPSNKFIRGSIGIIAKLLIKKFACDVVSIIRKTNDFMIILRLLVAGNPRGGVYDHTSGLIEMS